MATQNRTQTGRGHPVEDKPPTRWPCWGRPCWIQSNSRRNSGNLANDFLWISGLFLPGRSGSMVFGAVPLLVQHTVTCQRIRHHYFNRHKKHTSLFNNKNHVEPWIEITSRRIRNHKRLFSSPFGSMNTWILFGLTLLVLDDVDDVQFVAVFASMFKN